MTPSRLRIDIPHDRIAELCHRYHIRRLAFFGSVLRDDFRLDSDVDVLVEFEPDRRITYFTLAEIQDGLSAVLGRTADLHMPRMLHPLLRRKILADAEAAYVAA